MQTTLPTLEVYCCKIEKGIVAEAYLCKLTHGPSSELRCASSCEISDSYSQSDRLPPNVLSISENLTTVGLNISKANRQKQEDKQRSSATNQFKQMMEKKDATSSSSAKPIEAEQDPEGSTTRKMSHIEID